MTTYQVNLEFNPSEKFKVYLSDVMFEFSHMDNVAYHLQYLEYLYQVQRDIPLILTLKSLRIKTIIVELVGIIESLLYDAVWRLTWDRTRGKSPIKRGEGFADIIKMALEECIIPQDLKKDIFDLSILRNRIHLSLIKDSEKDWHYYDESKLAFAERCCEKTVTHFLYNRRRKLRDIPDPTTFPYPWKTYASIAATTEAVLGSSRVGRDGVRSNKVRRSASWPKKSSDDFCG